MRQELKQKIFRAAIGCVFIGGFFYGSFKMFTMEPAETKRDHTPASSSPKIPHSVETMARLKAAYQRKHYEEAIKLAKQIENEAQYRIASKTIMGNAYRNLNKPEEALKKYEEALNYTPYKAQLTQLIAMSHYDLEHYEKAEELFLKAIEMDPEDFDIRENLGTYYFNRQEYEKAEKLFLNMLKIQDDYSEAHKRIGIIYQAMGKKELALKHLEKYIELRPKAANAPQVQEMIKALKSS